MQRSFALSSYGFAGVYLLDFDVSIDDHLAPLLDVVAHTGGKLCWVAGHNGKPCFFKFLTHLGLV